MAKSLKIMRIRKHCRADVFAEPFYRTEDAKNGVIYGNIIGTDIICRNFGKFTRHKVVVQPYYYLYHIFVYLFVPP